MIVRDRMVRGGIVSSQRLARLGWVVQIFFHKLLHVCDDAGRFEANPALLRAALFGAVLHKVSERDVSGFLVACHEAGLVKLYTVEGRGYGEVLRFGQEGLRTRRVIYPAMESEPEGVLPGLGLAADDPPPLPPEVIHNPAEPPKRAPRLLKERRKEESPQPPAAAGGETAQIIESRKAARRYKSAERAGEALRAVENELTDILYPGGCSYKVQPTGEKLVRYAELMQRRTELKQALNDAATDRRERDRDEDAA